MNAASVEYELYTKLACQTVDFNEALRNRASSAPTFDSLHHTRSISSVRSVPHGHSSSNASIAAPVTLEITNWSIDAGETVEARSKRCRQSPRVEKLATEYCALALGSGNPTRADEFGSSDHDLDSPGTPLRMHDRCVGLAVRSTREKTQPDGDDGCGLRRGVVAPTVCLYPKKMV